MKRILYALTLGVLLSCCGHGDSSITVTTFEKEGELTAEEITVPVPFLVPRYLGVSGNYLFVYKEREDVLFSIFSLPDMKHLTCAGKRGQGPNDFNLLDTRSFRITSDGFDVIDANLNMLKEVCISDGGLEVKKSKTLFNRGMTSNGFYPLADGNFVTLGQLGQGEKEYILYQPEKEEFITIGEYPEWQEGPKGTPEFMTYVKTCVTHPKGNLFAAFYGRFKRWRLYDSSLNLKADIDVRVEPFEADVTLPSSKQPIYYIGQPYATDEYIYVLCSNGNTSMHGKSELQIWGWDGSAVARYFFDRKLSMIAISEKYKKIYAIDNRTEDKIFVYDFPVIE